MKGGVWDTSKRLLGSEVFPPELSAGEAASALLRTYGCGCEAFASAAYCLSLIHISEPTRPY